MVLLHFKGIKGQQMRNKLPILILLLATASATIAQTPHFCERMAAETKMKPAKDAPAGTAWQINKLGGVGTFLLGGQVSYMLSIKPDASADESAILANECQAAGADVICKIYGPADLNLTINGQTFPFNAKQDEAAKVSIIKSKNLRCEIVELGGR